MREKIDYLNPENSKTTYDMSGTFKEKSSVFRPIFLFTILPILVILTTLFIRGIQARNKTDIIIISCFIVANLIIILLLAGSKLELTVNDAGIRFIYKPYHTKPITYTWDQIQNIQLLAVNPITEFNGWGRKYSKKYGTGFLTKGDYVIHLVLKDGNKVTLTVLNPQQAAQYIAPGLLLQI